MTAWLEFRSEPVVEVPEIEIRLQIHTDINEGPERTLSCNDLNCGWWDTAFTPAQAIEMKRSHLKWHEDGMPE